MCFAMAKEDLCVVQNRSCAKRTQKQTEKNDEKIKVETKVLLDHSLSFTHNTAWVECLHWTNHESYRHIETKR